MSELKSVYIDRTGDWARSGNDTGTFYLKSEADKVIAEKDKEIAELNGQVNGFKNRSNLWHYNAVEEHKKFVQVNQQITELKEKHKKEVSQLLILNREQANSANRLRDSMEQVIRHHKYKRCLAMSECRDAQSRWCYQAACTLPPGVTATLNGKPVMVEPKRLFRRSERLLLASTLWKRRAEKFKEG